MLLHRSYHFLLHMLKSLLYLRFNGLAFFRLHVQNFTDYGLFE